MLARELHILFFEIPAAQRSDVFRAQLVEFVEQIRQWTLRVQSGESIERVKATVFSLLQYDPGARNPVRPLTVYQMRHDFPRAPRVRSFIDTRPILGKNIEQLREHRRSPLQDRDRLVEMKIQFVHERLPPHSRMIRT